MNLLLDERLPHGLVEQLRLQGWTLMLAYQVAASRQDTDVPAWRTCVFSLHTCHV